MSILDVNASLRKNKSTHRVLWLVKYRWYVEGEDSQHYLSFVILIISNADKSITHIIIIATVPRQYGNTHQELFLKWERLSHQLPLTNITISKWIWMLLGRVISTTYVECRYIEWQKKGSMQSALKCYYIECLTLSLRPYSYSKTVHNWWF